MTQSSKRGPGAPLGNKNGVGNKGRRTSAHTKTFNLTLPNALYLLLEQYRLEGYGPKSEIIASLMSSKLEAHMAGARAMAAGIAVLEAKRAERAAAQAIISDLKQQEEQS